MAHPQVFFTDGVDEKFSFFWDEETGENVSLDIFNGIQALHPGFLRYDIVWGHSLSRYSKENLISLKHNLIFF